jgi:hypothetical protein
MRNRKDVLIKDKSRFKKAGIPLFGRTKTAACYRVNPDKFLSALSFYVNSATIEDMNYRKCRLYKNGAI